MLTSSKQPEPPQSEIIGDERLAERGTRSLAEALESARALDSKDQMRLIAGLWESLPPKHQAAIVTFTLENLRPVDDVKSPAAAAKSLAPAGPAVWKVLFDPNETSDLYSAPRRFDLATIFVVMAAYSLLFGAMTTLDYYFDTPTKVAVGLLVTIVAVSQAYFQHIANPRGVSIVAGSIALSFILAAMWMIHRNWFAEPLLVLIVLGLIGGAIAGYLSGVMVGGVFLVADALRKYLSGRRGELHDNQGTPDSEPANPSESPWTN